MELVVRKTDLLRELQLFQGIVERKNTIPILANVLLEANGEEVRMLATDLEVGLRGEGGEGGVKVAADRCDSRMQTLPREDFPTLPEATGTINAVLPRELLRQMIAKTQFAI